ncbi:hypothetical protein ACLOJK_025385 [Asimina triloba]
MAAAAGAVAGASPSDQEPASLFDVYNVNIVPSELFLKFRKELEGFRVGINFEFYNFESNDYQAKLVLKPRNSDPRWKFVYEPLHGDVRLFSKKFSLTKYLNLQVGIGHNFQCNATGWNWKLSTCLGGDGVSHFRNKTSINFFPGFDLRIGWKAEYILPSVQGAIGTEEPIVSLNYGRLQASLDRDSSPVGDYKCLDFLFAIKRKVPRKMGIVDTFVGRAAHESEAWDHELNQYSSRVQAKKASAGCGVGCVGGSGLQRKFRGETPIHLPSPNTKAQTLPKMASSKLRSSSYFPHLLLSFLNFVVLLLSSASFAPTILIKSPPTPFGWAVIATSSLSLLSSFVGFYSLLTHACLVTHISILLASLAGQGLGFLVLFSREETSLRLLKPDKGQKEAKILAKLECGLLLSMFLLQLVVLVSTCTVQSCWVREYTGLEAEKEEMARRRGRRLARVQEESMANDVKTAEIQDREIDEKTKNRNGQQVKTDFEG